MKRKERKQDWAGGAIRLPCRSDRASITNVEYVFLLCLTPSLAEDGHGGNGLP